VHCFVCGQTILLSDTSSDDEEDDEDAPVTEAELKSMLKEHVRSKRYQKQFSQNKDVSINLASIIDYELLFE
jgi:hypothetical protein